MIAVQETIRRDRQAIALDVALLVREFEGAIDRVVQAQIRRFDSRLRTLTPDQQQAIQAALRGIASRILDPVIGSLKQAARQSDSEKIARIRGLLPGLDHQAALAPRIGAAGTTTSTSPVATS